MGQGAVSGGLIDIDEGTGKGSRIETPLRGLARPRAQAATERGVGHERGDAVAQALHISGSMGQRVDTAQHQPPGAGAGRCELCVRALREGDAAATLREVKATPQRLSRVRSIAASPLSNCPSFAL